MPEYPPNADSLMAILRRLRAPDGCPWDREQTRQSLVKCFDGECAELICAIDRDDVANIREELGDVLMNVLFQAVIAEEKGEFTLSDVWQEIIDKMIRRHAHVFGNAHATTSGDVAKLWQQIKDAENSASPRPTSVMDKVKPQLSILDRAEKLQKAAAKTGFDWQDTAGITDKIAEECSEVRAAMQENNEAHIDEELGDLLFAVINLIRFRGGKSASELLRMANLKFENRFRKMEECFAAAGETLNGADPETFDRFWKMVKEHEKQDEK